MIFVIITCVVILKAINFINLAKSSGLQRLEFTLIIIIIIRRRRRRRRRRIKERDPKKAK